MMAVCMRRVGFGRGVLMALAVCGAVSACADTSNTPASQRGFFGGIGAAVSGSDERRAAGLEQSATDAERKKQQLEARLGAANADAARTQVQVQAAEQRLAAVRSDLQRQKARLAAVRAGSQSGPSAEEAARLQRELDAVERERRAAQDASSAVTPATLQNLEERTRAISLALDRLGAV
jgi:predicted  nucleic acid-binding Zn-ribbon protein